MTTTALLLCVLAATAAAVDYTWAVDGSGYHRTLRLALRPAPGLAADGSFRATVTAALPAPVMVDLFEVRNGATAACSSTAFAARPPTPERLRGAATDPAPVDLEAPLFAAAATATELALDLEVPLCDGHEWLVVTIPAHLRYAAPVGGPEQAPGAFAFNPNVAVRGSKGALVGGAAVRLAVPVGDMADLWYVYWATTVAMFSGCAAVLYAVIA
jgi:hypothetical protein